MYNIRKATTDDIQLIRELTFAVWPQTYAHLISKEQMDYMLDWMYSPASLEKQMTDGAQFIIVYEEETPVGFASYQEIEPALFKLHKLYILGSQQGKGTGKLVINYIVDDIKPRSAKALQLQVNRENKALHFYKKMGFEVIHEADFDIGNGYQMNDYIMEKKI